MSDGEEVLTFAEMMDETVAQIEDDIADWEGEIPQHSQRILLNAVQEVMDTLTDIEGVNANEEMEDYTEEEEEELLADAAVDVLYALGAYKWEHDLDIEESFRERRELLSDIRDADSREELLRAKMGDEAFEKLQESLDHPQPGDDVSRDDYDGDPRSFA